jgi:hypothetical protein
VILEAFRPGTEPAQQRTVLDGTADDDAGPAYGGPQQGFGGALPAAAGPLPATGTGGLY